MLLRWQHPVCVTFFMVHVFFRHTLLHRPVLLSANHDCCKDLHARNQGDVIDYQEQRIMSSCYFLATQVFSLGFHFPVNEQSSLMC